MLTIGDLVSLDSQAQFRSDVQLDAYNDPDKNLSLLRSYLFSSSAPDPGVAGARSVSSIGLLNQIIEPLLHPRLPNRLVAIANYGHGKSHLALALANYFSRPVGSPEVNIVLKKIESAETDPARAARFRDFKRSRGEFLVVRLRGDVRHTLREQFASGLERALAEHQATAGVKPQFWHAKAASLLRRLSPDNRQRADAFLARFQIDVPQLLHQVETRMDVYEQCMRLFTELHGVEPNLGGEVSLKHAVNWAVETCCGEGKPLGGLVVIFDEFSLYVQQYAMSSALGELQDLLNGIDDQRGRAVFLAFAQHDPLTVADNMAVASQIRDNLKHELSRLEKKLALYSVLESVLNAYLGQPEQVWESFNAEPNVRGWLNQATDITLTAFKNRYQQGLGWNTETFRRTVTKGCFPLHPLTTAFLCNLSYGPTADMGVPRTVLGFVLEQCEQRRQRPAFVDGRVNWVLPTYLVDYFAPRLQGGTYTAYQNARRLLAADAPVQQAEVLKALLLQEMAGIDLRGNEQLWFLGHCAGQDDQQTKEILKALSEARAIRYDSGRRVNSFWPASNSPDKLQELLQRKLEEQKFDSKALTDLQSIVIGLPDVNFGQVPVTVPWGNESDWAAEEALLTADLCQHETLRSLCQPFSAGPREITSGIRGLVVWLIARNEEEVQWYRLNLLSELDKAFPDESPMPLVFVTPSVPSPELISATARYRALNSFSQSEREAAGHDMFSAELNLAKIAIAREFERLCGGRRTCFDLTRNAGRLAVPLAYRARVGTLPRSTVRVVLTECYQLAYRNAPPEYFSQYKLTQTKHRSAVKQVATLLLQNSPQALRQLGSGDRMTRDLCEKFLTQSWRLLSPDFRLREPDSERVRRAWQFLDESFRPSQGETPVKESLVALLNPPHGYDHNTLTLLFSAWIGYHGHDLQISAQGQVVSRLTLGQALENGPEKFIHEICFQKPVSLVRRDPGELVNDVRVLHERIQTGSFTQDEAVAAVLRLADFSRDDRQPQDLRSQAIQDTTTLNNATDIAKSYIQEVAQIDRAAASRNLSELTKTLERVGKLARPRLVVPGASTPAEVRQQVLDKIEAAVERDCQRYGHIERITQVDESLGQLRQRKKILIDAGLADLAVRIERAIQIVQETANQLEMHAREDILRTEIRNMDPDSRLSRLYEYQQRLEEIEGQADQTHAERNQRLAEVTQAITRLETLASGWRLKLDHTETLTQLDTHRSELLRSTSRFAGTRFESELNQMLARADHLRDFFTEIAAVQRDLTDGRYSTPDAVEQALQRVRQLGTRRDLALAEGHGRLLAGTEAQIRAYGTECSQRALTWLNKLEEEHLFGKPPEEILQRLASPPPFLPTDTESRLIALREALQAHIDEDVIASIESQFRKIADVHKRQACLERLRRIMSEA